MSERVKEWSFIDEALEERKQQDRLRSLRALRPGRNSIEVERDGRQLVNFCSNDYLGLAGHPDLAQKASTYAEQYGTGATASRLVSGTYDIHLRLEQKLADIYGREAALLFNSGFQANSTILQALTTRNSLILADKKSHNSLLQGSLLSRAAFRRFRHNDLDHLEQLLDRASGRSHDRTIIVTETVFSMDGDRSDVNRLAELAERYDAFLFLDDAHAMGVWGAHGRGLAHAHDRVDLVLGTFGKAYGVFGAFVVCSGNVRDYLVNFCPGFIYTTALPPPVIGALDAAADQVEAMDAERANYHRNIDDLRAEIGRLGYDTGRSTTQIIPVIIGDETETLELSQYLEENGLLATAIRPPTVPESRSRIRLTLSAAHTQQHLEILLKALRGWHG
ncbi:MAG: 8-amino-7-oxononanoate synthase [Balneolaceae bacterium]|nr:8-amino-7-oxononanoate synthase [Balneolaceae bacterium]